MHPGSFGFNAKDELHYRGRLDRLAHDARSDARRDLYEAMKEIAEAGRG